jgi:hypothetical protein
MDLDVAHHVERRRPFFPTLERVNGDEIADTKSGRHVAFLVDPVADDVLVSLPRLLDAKLLPGQVRHEARSCHALRPARDEPSNRDADEREDDPNEKEPSLSQRTVIDRFSPLGAPCSAFRQA